MSKVDIERYMDHIRYPGSNPWAINKPSSAFVVPVKREINLLVNHE